MASSGAGTDIVANDLDALIVAINPSTRSEQIGHPFSSPGNPFWRLLHESGLTPIELRPDESHRLLEFSLGLTSTVRRATPAATDLTSGERREGVRAVEQTIDAHRPKLVVLLGLTLYPLFVPHGTTNGPGPKPDRIAGSPLFVVPNPSGRNRAYAGFDAKLVWFALLAAQIGRGNTNSSDDFGR